MTKFNPVKEIIIDRLENYTFVNPTKNNKYYEWCCPVCYSENCDDKQPDVLKCVCGWVGFAFVLTYG